MAADQVSSAGQKPVHFLVVDDDVDSRTMIADYLAGMGYSQVSQARDGAEALRILERTPSINFVISDWDMPMVNGLTLLQKVKSSPGRANIPFLIVTSPISDEAEKVVMAAENLVDGYLIKPFRSVLLQDKINAILTTPIRGPQKQAVVIDDDLDAREMIVEYLKQMGFKDVVACTDGKEGLEYINANHAKIGLVVSDWEMPEMTGIDLLKACKGSPATDKIPFLMVTSQSSIERMKVMQAAKANVDQYLLKPFSANDIKARIETVLEKARTRGDVEMMISEALDHLDHGRFQRAQAKFEEAVALDPTHDAALRGLGEVLMKTRSIDEAIPYFRRAVEASPMTAKNYLRLASAYELVGWVDKAVALLQTANQQISFSAELHFHLGRLYNKKGMSSAAKGEFEKTLEIQLDHQEARLMLEMLNNRGNGGARGAG